MIKLYPFKTFDMEDEVEIKYEAKVKLVWGGLDLLPCKISGF